eukprot:5135720-Pyramimonas_sp.AAC.3
MPRTPDLRGAPELGAAQRCRPKLAWALGPDTGDTTPRPTPNPRGPEKREGRTPLNPALARSPPRPHPCVRIWCGLGKVWVVGESAPAPQVHVLGGFINNLAYIFYGGGVNPYTNRQSRGWVS